jgi:hypothetical protein
LVFVHALFIIKRKTTVIICRHQLGAATVKVTAYLQILLKYATIFGQEST